MEEFSAALGQIETQEAITREHERMRKEVQESIGEERKQERLRVQQLEWQAQLSNETRQREHTQRELEHARERMAAALLREQQEELMRQQQAVEQQKRALAAEEQRAWDVLYNERADIARREQRAKELASATLLEAEERAKHLSERAARERQETQQTLEQDAQRILQTAKFEAKNLTEEARCKAQILTAQARRDHEDAKRRLEAEQAAERRRKEELKLKYARIHDQILHARETRVKQATTAKWIAHTKTIKAENLILWRFHRNQRYKMLLHAFMAWQTSVENFQSSMGCEMDEAQAELALLLQRFKLDSFGPAICDALGVHSAEDLRVVEPTDIHQTKLKPVQKRKLLLVLEEVQRSSERRTVDRSLEVTSAGHGMRSPAQSPVSSDLEHIAAQKEAVVEAIAAEENAAIETKRKAKKNAAAAAAAAAAVIMEENSGKQHAEEASATVATTEPKRAVVAPLKTISADPRPSSNPTQVTSMGSHQSAPRKKSKSRRMPFVRASSNSDSMTLPADLLASGEKMFDVKVNSKTSAKKAELAAAQDSSSSQHTNDQTLHIETNTGLRAEAVDTDEGETTGRDDSSMQSDSDDSYAFENGVSDEADHNVSVAEAPDDYNDCVGVHHGFGTKSQEELQFEWQNLSIEQWFASYGAGEYVEAVSEVYEDLETMDQVANVYSFEDDTADELMETFGMDARTAAVLWGLLGQMKSSAGEDLATSDEEDLVDIHSDDDPDVDLLVASAEDISVEHSTDEDDME